MFVGKGLLFLCSTRPGHTKVLCVFFLSFLVVIRLPLGRFLKDACVLAWTLIFIKVIVHENRQQCTRAVKKKEENSCSS